jgi:hypothetical protein
VAAVIAWAGADFVCDSKLRAFANDGVRACWRRMHLAEPAPVPELVTQGNEDDDFWDIF